MNVETEKLLEEVASDLVEETLVATRDSATTTVHTGFVLCKKLQR